MANERQELEIRRRIASGVSEREELDLRRQLSELQPAETPTTIPGFTGPVPAQAGPIEEAILPQQFTEPAGRFTARAGGGLLNLPEGITQTMALAMESGGGLPVLPFKGSVPIGTSERLTEGFEARRAGLREQFPGVAGTAGEIAGEVAPAFLLPQTAAKGLTQRLGAGASAGGLFGAGRLSEPTAKGKLEDVAVGAGFGLGAGIGLEGLRGAAALRPKAILARMFSKAGKTPAAKKAEKALEKTGTDALLGQRVGSADISAFETQIARGVTGKDKIIQDTNTRLLSLTKSLSKTMQKIHGKRTTPRSVGESVQRGTEAAVKVAQRRRSQIANRDYAEFRRLGGDGSIIPTKNFSKALRDIAKDATVGDKGERFVRRVIRILNKQTKNGKVTAEQLRRYRSDFAGAAKGTNSLFKDIADANTRRVGNQIVKAIESDFDDAVKVLGQGKQNLSTALKKANENYAKNSEIIDAIEESVLGKLVGKGQFSHSEIARKLISKPSEEIQAAFKILSPARQQEVKRFIIEDAVNKATGKNPLRLVTEKDFTPENVFKELRKIDNIRSIFKGPEAREELRGVINGLKAIRIISGAETAASTGASPIGALADISGVAASRNPTFFARYAAKLATPLGLRKTLYTPEGRQAVITLAKALKGPKAAFTKTAAPAIAFFDQLDVEEEDGN